MQNNRPLVDLVSDTATRPTAAMLNAMVKAPLGDEQKGEDPTVCELELRAAKLLGTERALFLPSATMANQIALAVHTRAGDEVIAHRSAHVVNHETGGTSMNARAQLYVLDGARGIFDGAAVKSAIRPDDPHLPETRVVVVENTSNSGGGTVWPDDAYQSVVDVVRAHGLKLHIDGARLMNAAVRRGVEPSFWGARADTVQMCFSKGLGCPFGAVLALADRDFRAARRLKQAMGGALRQAGVIAGAMIYALDHNVERLADDHRRATALADGLRAVNGVHVDEVDTNLVFFSIGDTGHSPQAFTDALKREGVRMAPTLDGRIRACVHLDVDDDGIALAIDKSRQILA